MTSFFDRLGVNMDIPKASWESQTQFSQRLMLSSASAWMLTSMHARGENVSVDYVKTVVRSKVNTMVEISGGLQDIDTSALVDHIYEQLLANGAFYHTPYNLRPARHRLIHAGDVALVRGMLPEEDVQFSGMAPFILSVDTDESQMTEAFSLPDATPECILQQTWKRLSPCGLPTSAEYLNVNRRAGDPYYSNKRQTGTPMILARESQGFNKHAYYLLKDNEARRLTDDLTEEHVQDYCRLAIINEQSPQTVSASVGRQLVRLEIGYLLPVPELRFLRYTAWPDALPEYNRPWCFSIRPQLWPMLKERLGFLKYKVEERDE